MVAAAELTANVRDNLSTSSSYVLCQGTEAPQPALSTNCGEVFEVMIVQRWERGPETSVNKLLFAGSRMSVFPSGAVPV